ncbi:N-acyl homoserine lactonase family protein [Pseudonocardia acidicola]|uniref:N-acyl homoserine lactonase family protein n=1 Tax=Pseudonocardia acidicola TaxID=2724939 RepID=A0ABX1S4A9_9PSEU|nr:N-acyl homoserine lactonase family protein [Pseudonocardia acidicola]NMH95744.1 N-acyl homoserine lactonase family protein [Pseudonocardia acidicola]
MAGTKLSLLDLGRIDTDDGFFIRGCNAAVQSNPRPQYERRRVAVIAAVIEHPTAGPLLFETGCAQNARQEWPELAWDAFPVNVYEEQHHLDKALEAAGYGIDDIQAVVMGHLHLDHAGGLEHFRGKDIPIFAHELEIKEHYYAVATKEDIGAYVPGDLHWELNWQPIHRDETELFEGITVRHMPGHTPGLMTMQVQTRNSGHFILTSDLFHVRDLFEQGLPQGWLGRDSHAWWRSFRWTQQLQRRYDATMVYGHDASVLEELQAQAKYFD